MRRFTELTLLATVLTVFVSAPVWAEGPEMGHGMGPGHRMGMSEQGMKKMGSKGMHEKMQELHQHSKSMEGMKDQKKLMTEMRKHMQMTDEMMEEMMGGEGTAAGHPADAGSEHQGHPAPKAE